MKTKKILTYAALAILSCASPLEKVRQSCLEQRVKEPIEVVQKDETGWIKSPAQLNHEKNGLNWYTNMSTEEAQELIYQLRNKGIKAILDTAYMGDGKTIIQGYSGIYAPETDKLKESIYSWHFEPERENYVPKGLYKGNLEDVANVLQKEIGITQSNDKKPVLATFGLGPCIAVLGYDKINKTGFLIHADTCTSPIESILIYNLERLTNKKQEYEVHLIGGQDKENKKQVEKIINSLTTNNLNEKVRFKIVEKDLYGGGDEARSIALDTRTGGLFEFDGSTLSPDDFESRINQTESEIYIQRPPRLIYFPNELKAQEEGK